MSITLNEAHYKYINYHCYGNSLGTTVSEMAEICHLYKDKLAEWQAEATDDVNQYEFDDSEFQDWKSEGKDEAVEQTGYKDSTLDKAVHGTTVGGNAVAQAGGAGYAAYTGITAYNAAKTAVDAGKTAGKGFGAVVKDGINAVGKTKTPFSLIVQAGIILATALLYYVLTPNKKQKEAIDELKNNILVEHFDKLDTANQEMEYMANNITEAVNEAEEINKNANNEIARRTADYDVARKTQKDIKNRADSGNRITAGDRSNFAKASSNMASAGSDIKNISTKANADVSGIYEDVASYQEGYDLAAEDIANTEGVTDYAEGFDEATRTLCYTEGTSRSLLALQGAIVGTILGIKAVAATCALNFVQAAINLAASVAAIFGGVKAGFQANEQFNWAKEIGDEINYRKETQEYSADVLGVYDEQIQYYEGSMSDIEGLEELVPTDLEQPTEVSLTVPVGGQEEQDDPSKDKDKK